MLPETILVILEIVGTIAFAISGAFVAIKVRFDVFGVLVVGCITAVGGGVLRDILIGTFPPNIFSKSYIIVIAATASIATFVIAYFNQKKFDKVYERIEILIIFLML